jgi:hypothetical protein
MNIASLLMATSAALVFVFGAIHLAYTFQGRKLKPRDPALQAAMETVHPYITRETTMWRAWIGFNATHSMSLILFGLVYGYLALAHGGMLFNSVFLLAVGLATLVAFLVLAKLYFFRIPLIGIATALVCYVASVALHSRP